MAKGRSLHIGIDSVDAAQYGGINAQLTSAENDATCFQAIAQQAQFSSKVLLTRDAKSANLIEELTTAADALDGGDIFFITFSGHGTRVAKPGKKNLAHQDTWLLYDRMMAREEIRRLLRQFKRGVRILVISESCFSGGIVSPRLLELLKVRLDLPGWSQMKAFDQSFRECIKPEQKRMRATILLMASSKSDENSIVLPDHGLFTMKLLEIWNGGQFEGSYRQMFSKIEEALSAFQTPVFRVVGSLARTFENQRPFTI